ncbi:HesA/MoeB/ThiF family protein [Sphingobacterium sp. BIGb0165]|uniref:HesA/MoeB/ThiF family protein n=1 Tax=Sphingobacterium sp. BIGb0165 TaxID=2940615 RepID=UPI002167BD2C|nr:HesA/MoeB/ThiF family protein [Sphingobacterium sp. BIGb0165]MCS4224167.1 adenylyltransferase/sulfurtransferase [Sphingobacterium sp. BIGb0165]
MEEDHIFERYSRQIFIEEIGVVGQRKIMNSKVLIVGAGGLGSPVLQYLAAAGIGQLGLVDFDQVELHNLNRQVIHSEKQLHVSKTKSAADYIEQHNSTIDFQPMQLKLEAGNATEVLAPYDIIVDCCDNFKTRYLLNETCVRLNKPLVYGSIYGFEGQLAVFNYEGSKHLLDLFPTAPPPEQVPNCDKNGVLGPLPGIIGSMMAMQVLKMAAGLQVDCNQLTIVDTLHWRFSKLCF